MSVDSPAPAWRSWWPAVLAVAGVIVLAPLVAVNERQAERIAELEREAGRYAAERDAAEARYAAILEA